MKWVNIISYILVIVGALNLGLIGFVGFDLIATIFGGADGIVTRIVYALIGLAGLYSISFYKKIF